MAGQSNAVATLQSGMTQIMGTLPTCETSAERPKARMVGQLIYNRETQSVEVWAGSAWVVMGPGLPTYTTTARNALAAREGFMIWNTTTKKAEVWTGSAWEAL